MTGWVDVASLADVQRRRKLLVEVGAKGVALFFVGGRVRAIDNVCCHRQRELVKGTVLGNRVVCPGHQWAFDLDTGFEAKMRRHQQVWDVKVDGGRVLVAAAPRPLPAEELAQRAAGGPPAEPTD